jgi:hypothetical protein
MILRHLLAGLVLALSVPALAEPSSDTAAAASTSQPTVAEMLAYHDGVAKRAKTKDFDALSRSERDQLAAAQTQIRQALDGKTSMSELDQPTLLAVSEAHEQVVALVTKADDNRLVCTMQKRIGSNRHTRECRTVAQIREDRESAQDMRMRSRTCDPSSGGCGGG